MIAEEFVHATSHADVAPYVVRYIGDAPNREHLVAALLGPEDRVLCVTLLAVGATHIERLRPTDVHRILADTGCEAYYLAHNYPSNREPSIHDLNLARLLATVGDQFGFELRDYLVLGPRGTYVSLRERGDAVVLWRDQARRAGAAPHPDFY